MRVIRHIQRTTVPASLFILNKQIKQNFFPKREREGVWSRKRSKSASTDIEFHVKDVSFAKENVIFKCACGYKKKVK